jgi:protein-tyrosine phosphatase
MYTFTTANAHFVTDRLVVGGDLETRDTELALAQLHELVAAGVTHVLDTRVERSDQVLVAEHAPEVAYLHLGVDDDGQGKPSAWFDAAVGWLDEAMASPDTVALVHCHMGVNRSPSLAFAYLLHRGMGIRAALDAIRSARSIAVIDYADAALTWYHERTGASASRRTADRAELARWRSENQLEDIEVVRTIRANEALLQAAGDLGRGSAVLCDGHGRPVGECWLFQVSPEWADRFRDWDPDETQLLPISRHRDEVTPGDVVLLWVSGPTDTAGLFGYAIVTETDLDATRPRRWDEPDGPSTQAKALEVEPVLVASEVLLTRTVLKSALELSDFELFGMPNRPNIFTVTHRELDAIAALLRRHAGQGPMSADTAVG